MVGHNLFFFAAFKAGFCWPDRLILCNHRQIRETMTLWPTIFCLENPEANHDKEDVDGDPDEGGKDVLLREEHHRHNRGKEE